MESAQLKNIFEYNDYRQYLSDYHSKKKTLNSLYSHRVFAQQAGLSSPSHLLMIIKGKRNLSLKTMAKFTQGLKLTGKEKKFFELLVSYNQTHDLQLKAKLFAEIISSKGATKGLHNLEKEKFNFLSKWYVVAIYVMADLKNFNADPAAITKRLDSRITVSQAKEALENLVALGMLELDSNGRYRQSSGGITVADDTRSVAVYNYHQSMLRLATEALKKTKLNEREINGATIAIPLDKLPELKEKIRAFRKEINQLSGSYSDPDQIYQLNIQLFPLTSSEET